MPPRKVDHRFTKCCQCGTNKTYIKPDGTAVWFQQRNKFGKPTGEYLCHDCYRGIDRNKLENRKCCICGSTHTYIRKSGSPLWRKFKGDDWRNYQKGSTTGKWDGKSYLCSNCYGRIISQFPDSRNSLLKMIANVRNRQVDPNTSQGKGHMAEQIVVKYLGIKNFNLESDNYCAAFDAYDPVKYHRIDIKGPSLFMNEWTSSDIGEEFDHLFILCMSKDYNHINRVYVIPIEFVGDKKNIKIYEDISKNIYEKFRIDEKPYDSTYHNMLPEDFPILIKRKFENKNLR